MTQRPSFNKYYLQQEFDKLDAKTQPVTLYLIGGGAMAFYGLKDATKDIDIILTSAEQLKELLTALSSVGYKKPAQALITKSYCKMQTNAIMENKEGFRWDLFINRVCNALMLSEEIKQRAKQLYKGSNLTVLITSKEDIFLFKGITEREADLDDMRILSESGLNWKLISKECQMQSAMAGVPWEMALSQNLQDLNQRYQIDSPIAKEIRRVAEKKLEILSRETLLKEIANGNSTVKGITEKIRQPPSFVRAQLKRLEKEKLIRADKNHKPLKFCINKS
jgi:transcription initiation factor TFIIIB Brf1 subunit/transcription initiation factor TFIIB